MLISIHHVSLAVADLTAATAQYRALLAREPVAGRSYDGPESAFFQLDNIGLNLVAGTVEGLREIAFATADLNKARHVLARRGVPLDNAARLDAGATYGVGLRLIEKVIEKVIESGLNEPEATTGSALDIHGLDHIVVATSNPDRAAALYGARLGLEMKLDRSNPDWGSRLLFFKCGDLIVEIAHDLKRGVSDAPDRAWGLSWRTRDIGATHARLAKAGVDISDIRVGRKPGTQVFTVRDRTAGVPTLVIGKT